MSALTATLRGRVADEALMVDACTITRAGTPTTDDVTGKVTYSPTTVYAGKCRVQQTVPVSKPADVGEAQIWLQRSMLRIPMSAAPALSDDLVTITASALDPNLAGTTYRIRDVGAKTHMTSRRYQIEQVTS